MYMCSMHTCCASYAWGVCVRQVYRLCDTLVDDVVTVSDDEIREAIRDCFEDTRALLEPTGRTDAHARARMLHAHTLTCTLTRAWACGMGLWHALARLYMLIAARARRRDLYRGAQEVGGAAAGGRPVRGAAC